ncbi:YqaJ viral recombinase family protein [Streptodolium elevatio]|uniref:YqaJ viral recombinase family protein n=1 Tax=Streptodolium elevatio TaxID=3157996 RepID=A0ABV3DJW9_9ACTN
MTAGTEAAATTAAAGRAGSAFLVGQFAPGSPEWREARAGSITATRIAAVLGLSPWESPFSLWHRMRGTVSDDIDVTPHMEWGTRHEPAISAKFAEEHPQWDVQTTGTWANRERPWQRATPDRLLVYRGRVIGVGELKTSAKDDDWGPDGSDVIPVHYRCQVLWQLDTLGLPVAHVACLISGWDYREYEIRASSDEQEFMRERAREFLDSIQAGAAPKIDGHGETYRVVKQLPDGVEDTHVDVLPQLADRYIAARAAMKDAETELNETRSLLLDEMGNALRAKALGELIAYRTTKPDGSTLALQPARAKKKDTA